MSNSRHAGRRVSNKAGWCFCALLLLGCTISSRSSASCLRSADPEILKLQTLADDDAALALKQVRALLDSLERAPHPDARRLAALYDVEAQAYAILELDTEARGSASKGLKFATAANDPVHIKLLSEYAESAYDETGIDMAIKSIETAQATQPRGSLIDTCLLVTKGLLEYRKDRPDLAIGSLTQAYRATTAPAFALARIAAAAELSTVLRGMGDYPQALALNQEVIDWYTLNHATLSLSVSRFLRGKILDLMGKYEAAIAEFSEARKLSVQLDDIQGIAFADLDICDARVELGQLDRAAPDCANAKRIFSESHSADEKKETLALLARIDLASGRPEKALVGLNEVLDHNGADLLPRRVASLYEWRARTNAALHNYHEAYDDLTEYLRRYAAANDAQRIRQAAALRARFETDREIERNALLKRELGVSQEQSQRQAQELRWNAIAAVSGVMVIALLIYFLVANLRYRKQLLRLASQDSLTGLPNRRRTAELATQALAAAADTPLTIAIIDMDHFKVINDRCGHAAGDYVLKEFARAGRESLRKVDVLGRWGGEEFLLVMPDATLDAGVATLERIRTLLLGIKLPASGAGLRVTLSAGIAARDQTVRSLDELIARADAALYAAKNEGRDLVRVADETYMTTASMRRFPRQ